jgi:hypothetical protein
VKIKKLKNCFYYPFKVKEFYKKEKIVNTIPEVKGINKFSLFGEEKASASIPAVTATNAFEGLTKRTDPKRAQIKPHIVPSSVLLLLIKRGVFPKIFPKMLAELSPRVSIAIDV